AFAALEAGCDMVLVCNQREEAARVADALTEYHDPVAQLRMARMHGRHPLDWSALHADPRWEQAVAAVRGYEENPELDLDV
ncbi:MAG: beta-N-acetylhexosaminidase, partial [Gammaproteobacteria bacterium]|nr:beta-N-acetylhexosaminidase [Gammaproteobacteria bacterium]